MEMSWRLALSLSLDPFAYALRQAVQSKHSTGRESSKTAFLAFKCLAPIWGPPPMTNSYSDLGILRIHSLASIIPNDVDINI